MKILSYIGVGDIRFGMSVDEVRSAINSEATPFLKTPQSIMPTDSFHGDSIHVFYKKPGICEAVEFYKPANPTLMGQEFVGRSFSEVKKWLEHQDSNIEIDDCGLTSFKLGIGLYVPDIDEREEALVESLIVFEKGYYDGLIQEGIIRV